MALLPASLLGGLGMLTYHLVDLGWLRFLAGVVMTLAILLLLGLVHQLFRPRISYRNGKVLFHLKAGGPIGIPVDVVEAFFLGQGLAMLPGWSTSAEETETVNLIARLSERAPQWRQMEIKPALGRWEDGYVVMRGTWCEPLTGDLIRRLNRRLGEANRAQENTAMNPEGNRS
jgi:hypothetical protein